MRRLLPTGPSTAVRASNQRLTALRSAVAEHPEFLRVTGDPSTDEIPDRVMVEWALDVAAAAILVYQGEPAGRAPGDAVFELGLYVTTPTTEEAAE